MDERHIMRRTDIRLGDVEPRTERAEPSGCVVKHLSERPIELPPECSQAVVFITSDIMQLPFNVEMPMGVCLNHSLTDLIAVAAGIQAGYLISLVVGHRLHTAEMVMSEKHEVVTATLLRQCLRDVLAPRSVM